MLVRVSGFTATVLAAQECLARGIAFLTKAPANPLPYNPKHHLDTFSRRDRLYILVNKLQTVVFVYHMLCALWRRASWGQLTVANTLGAFICFFLLYDLLYASFHRLLHVRWLYKYIHKHHHRQISPTRGNADAINVHPFEFLVGEYLHLLVVLLIPCHVVAGFLFLVVAGILASLNHTRYPLRIPYVYDVRNHDVHHRWPEQNFGQYTMVWDRAFGWFRPYEPPKTA